jgi:hypothetical protein
VLEALDSPHHIEGGGAEGDIGGIAPDDLHASSDIPTPVQAMRETGLLSTHRQSRDAAAVVIDQPPARRAKPTADVQNTLAGPDSRFFGEMGDEPHLRDPRSLSAGLPETVVDMLAPEDPVQQRETIVMTLDGEPKAALVSAS